jgi:hypothetical protein
MVYLLFSFHHTTYGYNTAGDQITAEKWSIMMDLTYLDQHRFTAVLVYDNGTEQGDWRLFPGLAIWDGKQLLVHNEAGLPDLRIPDTAFDSIMPATPELSDILGDAVYYVLLHIAALPEGDENSVALPV